MDIKEEVLIAEIERFKEEVMKSYVVSRWAESYTNTDPFGYVILKNENNKVWWLKTQAYQLWEAWLAAKAQAVPEGFVLVPRLLSDVKADQFAESRFNEIKDLFYNDHMDLSGAERERLRLRWVKNRARASQEIYKAMIAAQEPVNDSKN